MTPFTTINDTAQAQQTAQENMNYDQRLVDDLSPNTRLLRVYDWPEAAITIGYKQKAPTDLSGLDCGRRVTGGGIVFHSPGDRVYALAGWLNDPLWDKRLKSRLVWLRDYVATQLENEGVLLDAATEPKDANLDFCRTYFSPYELQVAGDKVFAMTMRRFKDRFLIQAILHRNNGRDTFANYPQYAAFVSGGLPFTT